MRLNKNTYNLINGNIITLNNIVPVANSITINNGKIESINSPNNSYKSIDLKQNTLLPGLVDAHFHLANFGKRLEMINLKKIDSIDKVYQLVKEKIEDVGPNCFVHGFGWDQTLWENQDYPSKEVLNKFQDNPIIIN